MAYLVDERDVHFNLFEYLKIGRLIAIPDFKEQNADLYKMVLAEALKFSQSEIDPINISGDRQECHLHDGKVVTPKGYKEAFKAFAENGFIGADVSTTYGGQGLPVALFIPMYEFFTGAGVSFSMYAALTRGAAYLIESFGVQGPAALFCPRMYSGEFAGTMCLTEPWAGTAVGDLRTTAKPLPDGTYGITGGKIFISSGDHDLTSNIIHLVLARVEGDAPGTKGISLFAIPKIWVNPDGTLGPSNDVNCVNVEHKMGIKAQATCSLNFGEAGKCRGWLIGDRSNGMKYMFKMMNEARLLCGLQGLALAATAYENALEYAKDRVQGAGKLITEYPDVRRNLAMCKALVEGMRGLLYKTALCYDLGVKSSDPAERERLHDRLDLMTPICKAYCSDVGFRVTEIVMQVYGGYGYCADYPIEQYMRDVKISSIYEGTNGVQALDLLGRKLSLKGGQLLRDYYEEVCGFAEKLSANQALKDEAAALKQAADTMGQVAMKFAELGMGGDTLTPQLGATPFLEIMGHVTLAHILLEQALVAQAQIVAGAGDAFYRNKVRTAKFFVAQVLPNVQARAKAILSGDKTALEMEL
jgi:alkylation response protein AidB-like acyl-CoA dehydrogenase